MGSTGSSRFSDYSGTRAPQTGSGSGGGGGSSGVDRCRQAFTCVLEEVAQCPFFAQSGTVPAPGSVLSIELRGRVFAVDTNGVSVGALPTAFNYLMNCLNDGIHYVGLVRRSTATPVPTIEVDFTPQ
jgi:hypothetical protein